MEREKTAEEKEDSRRSHNQVICVLTCIVTRNTIGTVVIM
jgi:hypothetical protein